MTDVLYTVAECGCLSLSVADRPEVLKHAAADLASEFHLGRTLHRIDVESFRAGTPPMYCESHRREVAERAALVELGL